MRCARAEDPVHPLDVTEGDLSQGAGPGYLLKPEPQMPWLPLRDPSVPTSHWGTRRSAYGRGSEGDPEAMLLRETPIDAKRGSSQPEHTADSFPVEMGSGDPRGCSGGPPSWIGCPEDDTWFPRRRLGPRTWVSPWKPIQIGRAVGDDVVGGYAPTIERAASPRTNA